MDRREGICTSTKKPRIKGFFGSLTARDAKLSKKRLLFPKIPVNITPENKIVAAGEVGKHSPEPMQDETPSHTTAFTLRLSPL